MNGIEPMAEKGETTAETAKEMTLFSAIRELNTLSWRLKDMVYGTKPQAEPKKAEEIAVKDKITEARNKIMKSNGRISDAIKKLEGIGK